ncbi:MAG: Nif3-like dinuclear metal center hexameric protein [Phycisphaerales bacterium]|nr:Nif3-like dinuclear metal center hexameric protein [Planctomycetota bacterium]
MKVEDVVRALESIAPASYAEPWDKVGLHAGRFGAAVKGPLLLTIDLTEQVLSEAENRGAGMIIAYHPPIWEPLQQITDGTPRQRIILRALEKGIAIYSPHTALDAVAGGMTDWLCEGLSGGTDGKIQGDCRAIIPHAQPVPTQKVKIVTFVPREDLDKVRNALASAGAGIIGNYSVCSFSTDGVGTFLGDAASSPRKGGKGKLEEIREVRLEMVCSKAALALAIETLRGFHPYETAPIDVHELMDQPVRSAGTGRRLLLDHPITVAALAERLKKHINRPTVRLACANPKKKVSTIGVCPGSGGSILRAAAADGCEVFVTGEMKHHDVMSALDLGVGVILGEHTSTERGYLPRLAGKIEKALPGARVVIAESDVDPVAVV